MNRYPGIKPFYESEAPIFFGREQARQDLLNLISHHSICVLYGDSGVGKTSLIQAGVIPKLKSEPIRRKIITIRPSVFPTENSILDNLLSQFPLNKKGEKTLIDTHFPNEEGLWFRLKQIQLREHIEEFIIFWDQFEEIRHREYTEIQEFKKEIAAIINEKIPSPVRNFVLTHKENLTPKVKNDLLGEIRMKILISLRSDSLFQLHSLSDYLPKIFKNLYELKALDKEEAVLALISPALHPGSAFTVPVFQFSDEALKEIVNFLAGNSEHIDPLQLQILATYIESEIQSSQITTIESNMLEKIFSSMLDFYEHEIEKFEPKEQLKVRRFLEEGLVVGGERVTMAEAHAQKNYMLTKEIIAKLMDARLIKSEYSDLGKNYEISNDYLLKPIINSYSKRKKKEEKAKEAQKVKATKERYLILTLAAVTCLLLVLVVTLTLYNKNSKIGELIISKNKELKKSNDLVKQLFAAQLQVAQSQYESKVEKGNEYLKDRKFNLAFGEYQAALKAIEEVRSLANKEDSTSIYLIDMGGRVADSLIQDLVSKVDTADWFEDLIKLGNNYFQGSSQELIEAKNVYSKALELKPNDPIAFEKLVKTKIRIEKRFNEFTIKGDSLESCQSYDLALESYSQAQLLYPDDPTINSKISELRKQMEKSK